MVLEIRENEILANHSTFKIGGPAKYFVVAKNIDEIKEAVEFAKNKNLQFFILGGGSNTLFRDEGYDGMIIKSQISNLKSQNNLIISGSGVLLSQLIAKSIEDGLAGIEWGIGIPGVVGGAVAVNCGAYGSSMSQVVKSITVLNKEGEIKKYSNQDCCFRYHESRFKKTLSGENEIILEVEIELKKEDKNKIKEKIKSIIEQRKFKIPAEPSVGSVFKNLILDKLENKDEFLKKIEHHKEKIRVNKFPAGRLIEDCGLKNKRIGGAMISDKHALFIVNLGNAKSSDVLELIKICKEKVKEKFGVDLEEEIVIV